MGKYVLTIRDNARKRSPKDRDFHQRSGRNVSKCLCLVSFMYVCASIMCDCALSQS